MSSFRVLTNRSEMTTCFPTEHLFGKKRFMGSSLLPPVLNFWPSAWNVHVYLP